ncbi:MAG TPA: polysaccharide biosynthesis C-terminal domain-containing protein [Streptosporangiaceae bacterium]
MTARARQVAHTVTARAGVLVLAGLSGVAVARALQPDGRGAYFVIVTIASITLSVGHLSIEQSQTWLWSQRDGAGRVALAANSVLLGLGVGAGAALGCAAIIAVLGQDRMPVASYACLALALAAIPGGMAVLYLNNILVLRARVDVVNRAGVLAALLQCVAILALGALGRLTLGWAVVLWTASMVGPLVVLLPAVRPRPRDRDAALARCAIVKGLRYHIGLASLFLLFRSDILILDGMTTASAVGLYSLAVSLAELTRLVTDSIAQVALPGQMERDEAGAITATVRATRFTALFAGGSVGLMCLAAPLAVPVAYGAAFAACVPALLALAPGLFALGATRPIGAFLLRLDRPFLASAMTVLALVLNVALNLALIPVFGIVGSAVASSLAYAMLAAAQTAWFLRATRTPLRGLLPGGAELAYTWARARRLRRLRTPRRRRALDVRGG